MQSFDQSLKFLLSHEPEAFIRFGLTDPEARVLKAIPSDLPSRGRDVDGGYLVMHRGRRVVAHLEFHRRHQRSRELAVDIAEAQIRLFRRERRRVVSLVWDLYGGANESVTEVRRLTFGVADVGRGSRVTYLRVNLRGLTAAQLLGGAPPALWPLVALTQDGANETGVRNARDAIEARPDLSVAEQADHLAVLWFVAEAEDVPVALMKRYISEEKLMESVLYKSIFEKGVAQGVAQSEARVAQSEARVRADTIVRVLTVRLGAVDPALRSRVRGLKDIETLDAWYNEALLAVDAAAAQQLADKILAAHIVEPR